MKKLLSLLGAFGLTATASATVVACGDKAESIDFKMPEGEALKLEKADLTAAMAALTAAQGEKPKTVFSLLSAKDKTPAVEAEGVQILFVSEVEKPTKADDQTEDYKVLVEKFAVEGKDEKAKWSEKAVASKEVTFKVKKDAEPPVGGDVEVDLTKLTVEIGDGTKESAETAGPKAIAAVIDAAAKHDKTWVITDAMIEVGTFVENGPEKEGSIEVKVKATFAVKVKGTVSVKIKAMPKDNGGNSEDEDTFSFNF